MLKQRMTRIWLVAAALLLGLSQAVTAAPPADPHFLSGFVFWSNGSVAAGAKVAIFYYAKSCELNATSNPELQTDSTGFWGPANINDCAGSHTDGDVVRVNASLGGGFNELNHTIGTGSSDTHINLTLQFKPAFRLIREQSNETGDGSTMTVRLVVYNNGNSTMTATNVTVNDTHPTSWTVTDNGTGQNSTAGNITWSLGNISADKFTIITYKIRAPSAAGNHTFQGNVSWRFNYNLSDRSETLEGTGHRVGVRLDQPLYEFDLDLSTNLIDVNRTAGNDTNYSARWSITNIGTRDASAGSQATLARLVFNHSRWTIFNNTLACSACANVTNVTINSTHSALQANITSLAAGATANVDFTIRTSFSDIDETVNMSAAANNTSGQDIFFRARAIGCAIAVSANFSSVNWTVTTVAAQSNLPANQNNGSGPTNMSVAVNSTGCTADLYIRGDAPLTNEGGDTIPLANEKQNNSTTDNTVTGQPLTPLSTSFGLVASNLGTSARAFFKFFLDTSASQAAGNYTNNVTLKAVKAGTSP